MSRVEPKEQRGDESPDAQPRRELSDRKPEKAEGDERTIDEALRNQEKR